MTGIPHFSPLEARVLGVLIEKEKTVPDSYPLSLNQLTLGCNQKTAREPVMNVGEHEVQLALDTLRDHSLIIESSGGRVMRYAHNSRRVFKLPEQSVALLAVLMLRGPQTPGELRINSERLYHFGDLSTVEVFLDELAETDAPWVVKLPKLPGAREHRWAHCLCGPVQVDTPETAPLTAPAAHPDDIAQLQDKVLKLQEEVAVLREMVEALQRQFHA